MTPLYEVRRDKVRRGQPILAPREELQLYQGYRSVYGFGPEAIEHIKDTNTTANLANFAVYSDLLLVDFDDNPAAADDMAILLAAYTWAKFTSGGRSIHYHIKITPSYGAEVPATQKEWMRQNFPKADLSIYRSGGMYRMVGTWHDKGRQAKRMLQFNEGSGRLLETPVVLPERPAPKLFAPDDELETQLFGLLGHSMEVGGRNYHMFKIGRVCQRLGMDEYLAADLAEKWNSQYCYPPMSKSEVEATLRSAYRTAI